MIEAPYETGPVSNAPEMPAGRAIIDLSNVPPEVIQLLMALGALAPDGTPMGGGMNVMEEPAMPNDPRVEAVKRALSMGPARQPSGF